MHDFKLFNAFFQGKALKFLHRIIDLALEEDGMDLTSNAIFPEDNTARAIIVTRQECVIAGLPVIDLVMQRLAGPSTVNCLVKEGALIPGLTRIAELKGQTRKILKAERVILNLVARMSGIATLTRSFSELLKNSGVTILDTRKTSPGMRYPEKYAVQAGGGTNHRLNLEEMLMIKDNHIDQCGSISVAVDKLRRTYSPCPGIEVECRNVSQVREAVRAGVQRIMLDNMQEDEMSTALDLIPENIESEISGRVHLHNINSLARLKPTFISSGAITHSAVPVDLSMKIEAQ
ncbi:carboxylating nicotinate-nucleotide diphosphorylase [Desulfonatronovibrio hydrogenovorans]|uniref:carboxylating nicotinate-nucleotide diphosphorylase n=1 Tax=Desulfonatronovibrio hydrogenovorans TaxID=53245 RepID=UPI00048FA24E|nr:carboxylating nicotinate-nucleotide diphosphorylase [Desulfonatronovibrio hydrogenovorans]